MPTKTHLTSAQRNSLKHMGKTVFWFFIGVFLGLFFLVSFIFIIFENIYNNRIYPGVFVGTTQISGKTKQEVQAYFEKKNQQIQNTEFIFTTDSETATISAKDLGLGYNAKLLAAQAYSVGRSSDLFANASLVFQAYFTDIVLTPSYSYSSDKLTSALSPLIDSNQVTPVDALFTLNNGRVSAFRPSSDGQEVDMDTLKQELERKIPILLLKGTSATVTIPLPVKKLPPKVTTADANNLGIVELVGSGTSLFAHSIPSRIYNVELAASRINGVLVPPGEVFSFAKAVGDVSSFTGYQQAYVIENGKTVLGDGGGVCQVSTTLFRAALNAGLPIIERHAHAYRVGYYEEDGPPGIDATVYVPSIDLKFKNDTDHSILIQTAVDPQALRLTFYLYGTRDGREVTMTTPVVTNQTPPPPDLFTDDPTLPKGTVKQVDFSAWGADVSFHRTVKKDGKVVIDETYISHYQPWQAAFLRGTGA